MQYRRSFIPGGCYFFTFVTEQRRHIFASESAVETLRQAFRSEMNKRPFTIDAIVILPDHLHSV